MKIKIENFVDKIKPNTERFKSIILVILFCAVLVLSSVYIVMTYEETIDSGSMINVNSMIFMSDKASMPNTMSDSMLKVTPSFIGYKYDSVTKGIIGNRNIIDSIYSVFTEQIELYLGKEAECIVYSEHEGNMFLNKCLNSEKFVYFKFHNAWVSSMLRAYTNYGESSDLTEFPKGEVLTVSEILLSYYLDQWRFITIDANGTVAEYKLEKPLEDFDIIWLSAYNENKSFIDFEFGANAKNEAHGYKFASTAIISNDTAFAKYFSAAVPNNLVMVESSIQDKYAELFFINLDRSGQFDSNESKDYIDSHGTLSLSSEGTLTYSASDNDGGISLSNYLGYENYSENYTVDDILRASARLLYNLDSVNNLAFGGTAYMSLNNVTVSGSNVVVEFGYYCDNIAIAGNDGVRTPAARIVCDGKKIISVSILSVTFIENIEKSPMLPQNWVLEQLSASKGESIKDKALTVNPLYVLPKISDASDESSYVHAEWAYSAK